MIEYLRDGSSRGSGALPGIPPCGAIHGPPKVTQGFRPEEL